MTDIRYRVPTPVGRGSYQEFDCHVVEPDEATEWLAQKTLELLAIAYTRQFEAGLGSRGYRHPETGGYLPKGSMTAAFDASDPIRIRQQAKRMQKAIGEGSTYAVVNLHDKRIGEYKLLCLAKVTRRIMTPSETSIGAASGYYLYTNDILARLPRRGLGGLAWHAALTLARYQEGDRLVLDGYEGSTVNTWFERLGFERQADEVGCNRQTALGNNTLGQIRYAQPFSANRDELLSKMEQHRQWLAEAESL